MNEFQTQLYTDLMALTTANEAFYFQDFELESRKYRIFNYRLASYTDFLADGALECRGHMFEVNAVGDAVRLASMPMQKFFNLNENPSTMNLDLTKVESIEWKADGSLISTYLHNGSLRLKSKGSLFSDQAIDAMKWLDTNKSFGAMLRAMDEAGFTVNLEWCAPHNRIVIGYPIAHLRVLNARRRDSGVYAGRDWLLSNFGHDCVIQAVDMKGLDPVVFVQNIPSTTDDIEGYIAKIGHQWVKIKTDKYLSLHHAKDSVNNPRRLFEAILDEGIDDLRSLFHEDVLAMQTIDEMQVKVDHVFNSMVKTVESFYAENKDLDRKSYAIKGQEHFKGTLFFGLVMNKYIGKPMEYKQFLKGKWKELGFRDTALDKTE